MNTYPLSVDETAGQRRARMDREGEAALDRAYAEGYAAGRAAALDEANRALADRGLDARLMERRA